MNSEQSAGRFFFASLLTLRQTLTNRRTAWVGPGALLLGAIALQAARDRTGTEPGVAKASFAGRPSTAAPLPVTAMRLESHEQFAIKRSFTGTLRPRRQADLAFERTAQLVDVLVDQGASVRQGQLLARIDTRSLEAESRRAEAAWQQAMQVLAELQAGPRRERIEAQRAAVDGLTHQVDRLASLQRRQQSLRDRDAISEDSYEQTVFELAAQRARLQAAQHELDELLAGARPEQIAAQKALVEQLVAQRDDVQIRLSQSELRAPFAGWIVRRHQDEGSVAAAGQPMLTLIEEEPWEAWIGVPPEWIETLKVGDLVQLEIGGRQSEGRIRSWLNQLDPETRTRTVIAELTSATASPIVPGQIVRITVARSAFEPGFWVPAAALQRSARGLWSFWVIQDLDVHDRGRAVARLVDVLHREGDRAYVRGMLRDGELGIVAGAHRLAHGQLVTPLLDPSH